MEYRGTIFKYRSDASKVEIDDVTSRNMSTL